MYHLGVNFLKNPFRRGAALPKARATLPDDARRSLSEMSILEIAQEITKLPNPASVARLSDIAHRCNAIALYDHGPTAEERERASELARILDLEIVKGIADRQDLLASYRAAVDFFTSPANITRYGVGSLQYLLVEEAVADADQIPFAMKPKHRALLAGFISSLTPGALALAKPLMIRELICQYRIGAALHHAGYKTGNAVLILHGLAAAGDRALADILSPDEYRALLMVPENYLAGRAVLVGLGLLPMLSTVSSLVPTPQIELGIAVLVNARTKECSADPRLEQVNDEGQKYSLLLALAFLRLDLARLQLTELCGEEVAVEACDRLVSGENKAALADFRQAAQKLYEEKPGTPVDFALLDFIMCRYGAQVRSQEELDANRTFMQMAVEWLNSERVEWLAELRGTIRVASYGSTTAAQPHIARILAEDDIVTAQACGAREA